MDGAMPPDRFDPWPPGIEPAVPIEGYANTFTHTPALPADPPPGDADRGDRPDRALAQAALRRRQPGGGGGPAAWRWAS